MRSEPAFIFRSEIPVIGKAKTVEQLGGRVSSHIGKLGDIKQLARRAIRLVRIKNEFAFISDCRCDGGSKVTDRNLFAGANIEVRLAAVLLHQKYVCIGQFVDIEKFS